ncbi:MAG: hypothetical protein K2P98_00350 [Neisseriaceae bacterium]|nr:hypothetical protein [Neisseriaceae bacterium]
MYQANVYKIFLASPSDVIEERNLARDAIADWNKLHSEKEKIILRDIGWDKDAFASTSQDGNGQDKINEQLLKDADFLIGIFWAKIGTATEAFNSGTLEEIDKHIKAGKEAMLCFSNEALPQNHDKEQFEKLTNFKNECYEIRGLVQTYFKSDFHKIIYEALTRRVNKKEPFVGFSQQIELKEQAIPVNSKLERLDNDAKELLITAANELHEDSIFWGKSLNNHWLIINSRDGRVFFNSAENTPREVAQWENALSILEQQGLIEGLGNKRQYFKVTHDGFQLADELNSKHS